MTKKKPHRMWYNQGTYPYTCEDCRKAFSSDNALQQHNRDKTVHEYAPSPSGRRSGSRRRSRYGDNSLYTCRECRQAFATDRALEQHKKDSPRHSAGLGQSNRPPLFNVASASWQANHPILFDLTPRFWQPQLPADSFLNKSMTPENSLAKLVVEQLQPTDEFNDDCGRDVNWLAEFIKQNMSGVAEFLVGGSIKKGTAVKGKADLDVVLFLNRFKSMNDFKFNLPKVITELKKTIKDNRQTKFVEVEGRTSRTLKIRVRADVHGEYLDVDVLPAYNNLKKGKEAVYNEMNRETPADREYYSSSLAPLQLEFVRERIKDFPNVKNLIRLVKNWAKTYFPRQEVKTKKYPTSYVLELITIHSWETGGKTVRFDMNRAFKTIMTRLVNFYDINISWSDYYDRTKYSNSAKKENLKPYILDPANPFNNVGQRFDSGWSDVGALARLSMNSKLLKDVDVYERHWG